MPGQMLQSLEKFASVLAVSTYLAAVGCLLLVTGRIRVSPRQFAHVVGHRLLARFRPPFSFQIADVTHEGGHCYVTPLRKYLVSDLDGRSRLVLFEDGQRLPHPHSSHDDIRELGAGRYSHWGDAVYFSSSDHTDPSANRRRYTVKEVSE